MTNEQARALQYRDEIHFGQCKTFVGPRGGERHKVECWRVNGTVKTWKTRPDEFQVPIKFGYNGPYSYITKYNVDEFHFASECVPVRVSVKPIAHDDGTEQKLDPNRHDKNMCRYTG